MNATEKAVVVERQVRLFKMPQFDAVVEAKGARAESLTAIGYLSQWAFHKDDEKRIVKVTIGLMDDGEIHALYRDAEDRIVYEIGAILREDGRCSYFFHS